MRELLQWAGAFFGIGGALMLAMHKPYSGYGWYGFLISNLFWIAYALDTATHGLLVQQAFFTGTSVLGIWRWRMAPPSLTAVPSPSDSA